MPPSHPDASSAETKEVGSRNTTAGTRYKNTHAKPYTAMVGAARRLATELVVIIAKATQEIQAVGGILARAATSATASPALIWAAGVVEALVQRSPASLLTREPLLGIQAR